MALLAFAVRERSDGEQVVAFEQAHTVLEAEAFACLELVADTGKSGALDSCFH